MVYIVSKLLDLELHFYEGLIVKQGESKLVHELLAMKLDERFDNSRTISKNSMKQ